MEMHCFTRAAQAGMSFEPLVTGVGPMEAAYTLSARLANGIGAVRGVLLFGVAGAYCLDGGQGAGMLDICLAAEEVLADLGICYQDRLESFRASELAVRDRFILDTKLFAATAILLQNKKIEHRRGRFLTVNCVSGTRKRGNMLATQFNGLCENMEGAAVARVCEAFALPCLELRCISNFVEDRDVGRWQLKEACRRAGETAAFVCQQLSGS